MTHITTLFKHKYLIVWVLKIIICYVILWLYPAIYACSWNGIQNVSYVMMAVAHTVIFIITISEQILYHKFKKANIKYEDDTSEINLIPYGYRTRKGHIISTLLSLLAAFPWPIICEVTKSTDLRIAAFVPLFLYLFNIFPAYAISIDYAVHHKLLQLIFVPRIILLFAAFVTAMHIWACIFLWTSLHTTLGMEGGWVILDNVAYYDDDGKLILTYGIFRVYLRSLYTTSTNMVPAGFGDIVPQNIKETVVFILFVYTGYYFQVIVLSNIKNFVAEMTSDQMNHEQELDNITQYLKYRNIPHDLQKRVRAFYDYMFHLLEGLDEQSFIDELPPSLKSQVAGEISGTLVRKIPFLRSLDPTVVNAIVIKLKNNVYSPGDLIIPRGKTMKAALLFSRGEIDIYDKKGKVKQTINCDQGHIEYETACIMPVEATDDIKAKSYCEVYELDQDELLKIIKNYIPDDLEKIKSSAENSAKSKQKAMKMLGNSEDENKKSYTGWKTIFLPNSTFRLYWGCILALCTTYVILVVPYSFSYFYWKETSFYITIIVFNCIADLFFVVDVFLRMKYFAYSENGIAVCNKIQIYHHYKKQHPIIDLITGIPFEYLLCIYDVNAFNFLRVVKLLRCVYYGNQIGAVLELLRNHGIHMSILVSELFKWLFAVYVVAHYLGTIFYFVGLYRMHNYDPLPFTDDWITTDNMDETLNVHHNKWNGWAGYLRSVYWAIVATTSIGYGDIKPKYTSVIETIYVSIAVVLGGIGYPVLLGSLASVLQQFGQKVRDFKQHMTDLRLYFEVNKIEKKIGDRAIEYCDYIWSRQHGIDENGILSSLPLPLRTQIADHILHQHVNDIPFLQFIEPQVMHELYGIFEPMIFLPDDTIILPGTVGSGMFMIERGVVRLTAEDGTALAFLSAPQFVGSGALINKKTKFGYYAEGYCDGFLLPRNGTLDILDDFPEAAQQLKADILEYETSNDKFYNNITENLKTKSKLNKATGGKLESNVKVVSLKSIRHPDSTARRVWYIIVYLCMLYLMIIDPLRVVVTLDEKVQFFLPDWICYIILLADFYLHLNYFGFMYEGSIHCDKMEIRKHYTHSFPFYIHLIATIPWEVFAYFAFLNNTLDDAFQIISYVRIVKVLYCLIYSDYYASLTRFLEDYPSISKNIPRAFNLLITILLTSHFYGAVYLYLGRYNNDGEYPVKKCERLYDKDNTTIVRLGMNDYGRCLFENTWIQKQIEWNLLPKNGGPEFSQYMRAIYFCITTLLTADIGDGIPITDLETLFTIVLMIGGILISSIIIGEIADMAVSTSDNDIKTKMYYLYQYFAVQKVPYDLTILAQNFVDNFLENRKGTGEEPLISDLPETLKHEISMHYKRDFIVNCCLFENIETDIQEEIATVLKYRIYNPEDMIYRNDNPTSELYFIKSGSVRLYHDKFESMASMVVTLSDNQFFNEFAFFYDHVAHENAKALTFVDILFLTKNNLARVVVKRQINPDIFFQNTQTLDTFEDPTNVSKIDRSCTNQALGGGNTKNKMYLSDVTQQTPNSLYFPPTSKFVIIWKSIGSLMLLYYLFTLPFVLAFFVERFLDSDEYYVSFVVVDAIVYVYFLLDSILNAKYFAFIWEGVLVTSQKDIWKHYKKTRLVYDVISLLPLGIVSWFSRSLYPYMRLIHCLRLYDLPSYTKVFTHLIAEVTGMSDGLMRMISILLIHICVSHYGSCIWFFIHRYIEKSTELTWANVDKLATYDPVAGEHNVLDESISLFYVYVRGIHFVLSVISSVGIGDIRPYNDLEVFWSIVISITCAYLVAINTGAVSGYFMMVDAQGEQAFLKKMSIIKTYMMKKHFSENLQESINNYFEASWNNMKGVLFPDIIKEFPISLQEKIAYHTYKDTISKITLLNELPEEIKRKISLYLKVYTVHENEFVYREGEIRNEIYFIVNGSLVKTGADGYKNEMCAGESFGCFISDMKNIFHKYSVRALQQSKLLTIDLTDLETIRKRNSDSDTFELFSSISPPRKRLASGSVPPESTGKSMLGQSMIRKSSAGSLTQMFYSNTANTFTVSTDPFFNFCFKRNIKLNGDTVKRLDDLKEEDEEDDNKSEENDKMSDRLIDPDLLEKKLGNDNGMNKEAKDFNKVKMSLDELDGDTVEEIIKGKGYLKQNNNDGLITQSLAFLSDKEEENDIIKRSISLQVSKSPKIIHKSCKRSSQEDVLVTPPQINSRIINTKLTPNMDNYNLLTPIVNTTSATTPSVLQQQLQQQQQQQVKSNRSSLSSHTADIPGYIPDSEDEDF